MGKATTLVRFDPGVPPKIRLPDSATFRYEQHVAPVWAETAHGLGLQRLAYMVQRLAFLSIDGRPVLFSNSYLPVALADEPDDWRQVELGTLALVGHDVTVTDRFLICRMPTPEERELLGISRRPEVPIWVFFRAYHIHDIQPEPVRAGVVVRARGDLVSASCGLEYEPGGVR